MPVNSPLQPDGNETSKYSLADIAEEFITWDAATTRQDNLRISFVQSALTYSYLGQSLAELLPQFMEAYTKVYNEAQAKGIDANMPQPAQVRDLLGVS
jgi:hypothetical protein